MQITIQRRLVTKIFCLLFFPLLLAVMPSVCFAQSALSPGDLVMVKINSGNPAQFDFVPLIDLEKKTMIYFTDNAYVSASGSLTPTEGTLVYTASEVVPAGTVISFDGREQNEFTGSGFETTGSGDNILVYQASGSDTTFIYGIGWGRESSVWTYSNDTGADSHSDIPPGLSEAAYTAVRLGPGQNHTYDPGKGSNGTPKDLARLTGNSNNWRSGEQAFSGRGLSFTVIPSPVIRFTTDKMNVSETDGEVTLSVELVEANGQAVSADVAFMSNLSTVSQEDIGDYSTQSIGFSETDSTGTTKTITINIANSSDYNGRQKAVFSLRNTTNGSVTSPQNIEIEIEDSDVPLIVINEINADPGDDADGNGIVDSADDEFIEFVNNENTDVDMSGWTFLDDNSAIRHVFPEGTVIPAFGALVLFANESVIPSGNFGGAVVQNSNRSSTLDLDESGDRPTLKDASGKVVASYPYGSEAGDKQSITRTSDPDGSLKKHSAVSESNQLLSSPGIRTDGSSFGPGHTIDIHGQEGWRIISGPAGTISFKELIGAFRTQGIAGSDAPAEEATIYFWDETDGGTKIKPADITEELTGSRGYMIYFFEDDETGTAGIQGGFPKTIRQSAENSQYRDQVSVLVSATDANGNNMIDQNEGFNLLGNPFDVYISVTAVLDAFEQIDESLNRNILVWNPAAGRGNGAYEILTDGDVINPFQAFFVRYMTIGVSGSVMLNKTEVQVSRERARFDESEDHSFGYKISLNDDSYYDTYKLVFREGGNMGQDKLDAYKLFSLNPASLNLYSREGTVRLMESALPGNLNTVMEIPLLFEAPDDKRTFEFTWEDFGQLPADWNITLRDKELNKEVDLRNSSKYSFTLVTETVQNTMGKEKLLINQAEPQEKEPRFVLLVNPATELTSDQSRLQESVKLDPNYPNPFNSTTRIPFVLPAEAEVQLSIWNIVGQKVATLIDGIREAGPDEVEWNASDMPSGIYIAQMEVGGNVYIRKMTLIKY